MRYVTALPIVLLLVLVDLVLIVSLLGLIVMVGEEKDLPFSYHFARSVWCPL